jgi:hypothetical protein
MYKKNAKHIDKETRENFDFEFSDNGDVTLTMKHITVKDFEAWSDNEAEYFMDLTASMAEVDEETSIN